MSWVSLKTGARVLYLAWADEVIGVVAILALALLSSPSLAQTWLPDPPGRLTLQRYAPIQLVDQVGSGTLYRELLPGKAPFDPVPTLGVFAAYPAGELLVGLGSISAGYSHDVWELIVGGVPVMCIGPRWSSATRSSTGVVTHTDSGAGGATVTISPALGYLTNGSTIGHCIGGPAASIDYGPILVGSALYLGSGLATANGQMTMAVHPAAVAGGAISTCGVFNAYNRHLFDCTSRDANGQWFTTSTDGSHEVPLDAAGDGTGLNRIVFLDPLGDQPWDAEVQVSVAGDGSTAAGYFCIVGFGFDTTAAINYTAGQGALLEQNASGGYQSGQFGGACRGSLRIMPPPLGAHYLQAMEISDGYTWFFGSDYGRSVLRIWM